MKRSYILAVAITGVLGLWVLSGAVFSDEGDSQPTDRVSQESETPFAVRVRAIGPREYTQQVEISGRTVAERAVELKAEVEGQVVETPVEKGERVGRGVLLCRIAANEREANLQEARALVDQRRLEYEASQKLAEKGHRSETQVSAAKAELEAALAQMRQMEVALDNTTIEAPFAGLVESRPAEIGAYLQRGDVCARLVDEDPFLVVGEVSENQVDALVPNAPAIVEFTNGETLEGRIRFIAGTATERTRTFPIEVAVPNEERTLREGMSAGIRVPVETRQAHFIPPTVLVLDEIGQLGLRAVDDDHKVRFHPIRILDDTGDGLWVAGLPGRLRVITVGQGFVRAGEEVRPVAADPEPTS